MRKRALDRATGALILALALAGCSSAQVAPAPTAAPAAQAARPTQPPRPTAAPRPTEAPAPTAAPAEVLVSQLGSFRNSVDQFTVVGMIRNGTDRPITSVELKIVARAADGSTLLKDWGAEPVEEATFAPLARSLAPGEESPFAYSLASDAPEPASYEVTLAGYEAGEAEPRVVEVRNAHLVVNGLGATELLGELVNLSPEAVSVETIKVAAFDAAGAVIAVEDVGVVPPYLDPADTPSASAPFDVTLGELDATAVSWAAFAHASPTEEVDFQVGMGDFTGYFDDSNRLHLVGTITNEDAAPLAIELIGGFYDADGLALGHSAAGSHYLALPPGASLPVDFKYWSTIDSTPALQGRLDRWTVQVNGRYTSREEQASLALETSGDALDGASWTATGELVNTADLPVSRAVVVAALVNAEGAVVATNFDVVDVFDAGTLPPGATAPYSVTFEAPHDLDPEGLTLQTYVYASPAQ